MQEYIIRRVLLAIPTLIGAVTLVFLVMRILPGDIASLMLEGSSEIGIEADEEQLAALREQLGIDKPLYMQYLVWMWDAIRFDFGDALWTNQPVWKEFELRYPISLSILILAMITSLGHSPARRHHIGGQARHLDRLRPARLHPGRPLHPQLLRRNPDNLVPVKVLRLDHAPGIRAYLERPLAQLPATHLPVARHRLQAVGHRR